MSHGVSIGDFVNPAPLGFPDYERWNPPLNRNCRGLVTAVAADGRITVNWNPKGPRIQEGIYRPDQIMAAVR
jgi:hypothetical protein